MIALLFYAPNGDNMPTHFPNKYNRNILKDLFPFIKDKMANYVRKLDGLLGNRYENVERSDEIIHCI